MNTLGTSSLKYIREHIPNPATYTDLQYAVVAFVGTQSEVAPLLAHPTTRTALFVLDRDTAPILGVTIYIATDSTGDADVDVPTKYTQLGTLNDPTFIQQAIYPAGGLVNAIMSVPRGGKQDINGVPKIDGLFYYNHEHKELYIYDITVPAGNQRWVRIAVAESNIGVMSTYPEAFGNPPAGYLRCDGTVVDQNLYPELYAKVNTQFGAMGTLPTQSNAIIRAT